MAATKSLFRETIIYSIGAFGSKILKFLLVPLYTFFLTKEEMGEYDLFLTTIILVMPLASLQISDAVYRWLVSGEAAHDEDLKSRIISTSLVSYFVCFALFTILFCIYRLFYDFAFSQYFIACLFLATLLPLLQYILRGLGKIKEYAANGIITSFFLVLLNVILIWGLDMKVVGILLANIFANALVSLIIIIKLKLYRRVKLRLFDKALAKRMLHYSLPLIPNLMSWWLIASASKFIILDKMGVDANGIYAISSRFPSILVIVNSVFILPIQDLFLKENSDFERFKSLVSKFLKLELSLVLLLSIGAPVYTKFFVSSEFYRAWQFMPLLYMGVGFNAIAVLIGLVYQKEKKTARITVTTLFGGVVSIGSCFLLISFFHLDGVSFTFFLGYFIMFLLRYFDTKKHSNYKIPLNFKAVFVFLLVFVGALVVMHKASFLWQIILFVIAGVAVVYINKKIILDKLRIYVRNNNKKISSI